MLNPGMRATCPGGIPNHPRPTRPGQGQYLIYIPKAQRPILGSNSAQACPLMKTNDQIMSHMEKTGSMIKTIQKLDRSVLGGNKKKMGADLLILLSSK